MGVCTWGGGRVVGGCVYMGRGGSGWVCVHGEGGGSGWVWVHGEGGRLNILCDCLHYSSTSNEFPQKYF